MKKIISLLTIAGLLVLCGCTGAAPADTTPAATETSAGAATEPIAEIPAEAATEAPAEPPAPTNPLTGETLETPMESRVFAVSINNVPGAMPMHGVSQADIFFEMFVNDYCTRGLALYSDIGQIKSVGSVRSLRYNFTDLCRIYDAVVVHAGGSNPVMADLSASGVDNVNVGYGGSGYYYRDQTRLDQGYALEHTLFIRGAETLAFAESSGTRITRDPGIDYGLRFTEDGTPAEGEEAGVITVDLTHGGITKQTVMKYDAEAGKYLFCQYDQPMYDAAEQQDILFENVIVMLCNVYNDSVYHVAELTGSGEGFFACGGKIIPVRWSREDAADPITFTHADGMPLLLGVGNSYIAVAPLTSAVSYE